MPSRATEEMAAHEASADERRTEPRLPAEGEGWLALGGPVPRTISGQLLDTSRSGSAPRIPRRCSRLDRGYSFAMTVVRAWLAYAGTGRRAGVGRRVS